MKKAEIPILKKKAYRLIPISQATLYKKLKLSSQDGSKLVYAMLNENILKRKKIIENNRVTYMLYRKNSENIKKPLDTKRFDSLINVNNFSPCTGCPELECKPVVCTELNDWILS